MKTLIYTILIALYSCQSSEYDFERKKLVINDQQVEILTAYAIFDNYLAKKSSYSRNIIGQIESEFKDGAEYTFLFESIKKEIKPDFRLKEELKLLKDIDFEQIVDSAFQIVTKELPGPDTKILFIPANPAYRELYEEFGMGIHAITLGKGKIIVSIDPTFNNWPQLIPYVLAHEYHHSVWTSRNFETINFSLLEYLILEGKADSFARGLFSEAIIPWFNMLSADEENRIWRLIRPEINKRNPEMNAKIMNGTNGFPYASGYAIGYSIIKSFKLNNPEINDVELIDIPAKQILHLSKYDN